jgi:ribose transport system substrate-binding protein
MRPPATPRRTAMAWLVLLAFGCGGEEGPPPPPEVERQIASPAAPPARIGAVLPMFSHPFFVAQRDGLRSKAQQFQVAIDIRDGQDDDRTQLAQVETLLNLGCDALILCPRDEEALVPAVEAANRARVPVIALNRRVNGGRVVCYVGADDVEGGKAQGEALIAALGSEGGKILYLQGTQGSSPQRQRNEGFRAVLARHREITIADDRFADFQEDRAKTVMTGLVRRFAPGQVRAIVAQSDEMALPAAEVAHREGWKDVVVIGFDGTAAAFDAIREGTLTATVLQDAAQQGAWAVEVAVDKIRGKLVPPERITPLPIITKANVAQFKPAY